MYKQAASGNFAHMQVVQAPTWEVNTTIRVEFLEHEKTRDPELFKVEYGAEFTGNIAAFIDNQLVDAAINSDRGVLPPLSKFKGTYYLALDPAQGDHDAYTACIVHYDGDVLIIDQFYQFAPSWGDGKKLK